jgi:hypothetical protein
MNEYAIANVMSVQPAIPGRRFSLDNSRSGRLEDGHALAASFGDEAALKLLLIAFFLPEGLSFFIGDYRLSVARALLICLSIVSVVRLSRRIGTPAYVFVPSDFFALMAGAWIVIAATATSGVSEGLKGGGALALEFTGSYCVFRSFLGPMDSSVRVVGFACKLIVVVVFIALLDPLTGKLFTYEAIKGITGYTKAAYEVAIASHAETLYRNGSIRAMGPMEHSILFGLSCAWFGTLAICTFPRRSFGWIVGAITLIGIFFSRSQGAMVGYLLAIGLAVLYRATPHLTARWKILQTFVVGGLTFIFLFSGKPIATLLRLGGISPETGWYREAIWDAGIPVVAGSPLFGIGMTDQWDWQSGGVLVGASVDTLWLELAMTFGIPGSLLVFLAVVGAFWLGSIDRSPVLSGSERRLSVALGFVTVITVFEGFSVHLWGTCWMLLGVFAGMRASLADAAIRRQRGGLRMLAAG